MAELTNDRLLQLQQVAAQYVGMSGGYSAADLVAAGFSPTEVAEFDAIIRQDRPEFTGELPDEQYASAREPTRRERHAATLSAFFGGDNADRDDYRRALKLTGTTDPSAVFADQMGLADLTPLSALYGIEEGGATFARGYQTQDLGTMAMGGLEAGLGVLEAAPGVGAAVSGAKKLAGSVRGIPALNPRGSEDAAGMTRRDFLAGAGAAGVTAGLTPDLMDVAKMAARKAPVPASNVGALLARKAQRHADYMNLSDAIRPLDQTISAAGRLDLPDPSVPMTPELAQARQAAGEALQQRRAIAADLQVAGGDLNSIDDEITDTLLELDDPMSAFDGLEATARDTLVSDTLDNLVKRSSQRQGAEGSYDLQEYIFDSLDAKDTAALEELGLTKPEIALADNLWTVVQANRAARQARLQSFQDGGMVNGRQPVPADRAFSRDVGILENARRFGYNALDSLIGFDDGYDTAGERAGKRIKGKIDAAIADPLGVTAGAMQSLMDTYDRVATPLTSEEIMAGKSPAALDALALASIPMTGVFGASRTADLVSANPRGPRAAPPRGGKEVAQPERIFDPAQNRTLPVTPRRELTADERMAAAQALPTTFRLVRAPIGGQKSQSTSSQGDAIYDPVTGQARSAPQRRPADVFSMSAESVAGDPTKEWMEIPSEVLGAINMRPEQFSDIRSRLSRDGRTLYLASGPDTALFLQAWKQQAPFFNLPEMPNLQRPTALPNTSILGFPRLPGRPERSAPPNPERAVEGRRPFTPRPPRTFD